MHASPIEYAVLSCYGASTARFGLLVWGSEKPSREQHARGRVARRVGKSFLEGEIRGHSHARLRY